MEVSLLGTDRCRVSVDEELQNASTFITRKINGPGRQTMGCLSLDVPCANKEVLHVLINAYRGFKLEAPKTVDAEGAYCTRYILPCTAAIATDLLRTIDYLAMDDMQRIGCRAVTEMIRGCSPADMRQRLGLDDPETSQPSIMFANLSETVRRSCYDSFAISAEIIPSFYDAVRETNNRDLGEECRAWLKEMIALSSPDPGLLQKLVPGSNPALVWNNVLHLKASSKRAHDYCDSQGKPWRPTPLVEKTLRDLPIGRIRIEKEHTLVPHNRPEFLTFCSRQSLEKFSQNWVMFCPTAALVPECRGDESELRFMIELLNGVKPNYRRHCYRPKLPRKFQNPEAQTLETDALLSFFRRIENKEYAGYPEVVCLDACIKGIRSILDWHDDPRERYMSGRRLQQPLTEEQRTALLEIRAMFMTKRNALKQKTKKARNAPIGAFSREKRLARRVALRSVRSPP